MKKNTNAPFTPDQVESINGFQQAGWMHPFTCDSGDCRRGESGGVLVATEEGMHCRTCDWKQGWVMPFMADNGWKKHKPPFID